MRHSRAALVALALLAAIVVLGGCGSHTAQITSLATAPPSISADITGTIHDVRTDAATGRAVLEVVDDGAIKGSTDRAVVRVTEDTVVWMLKGGRGTPADLGAGQMVSVWFDGPVAESYPVQAKAGVIKILLED